MTLRDKGYSKAVPLAVPMAKALEDALEAGREYNQRLQKWTKLGCCAHVQYPADERLQAKEDGNLHPMEVLNYLVKREERDRIVKQVRAFCARYSTPLEAPERAALTRLAAEIEESVDL